MSRRAWLIEAVALMACLSIAVLLLNISVDIYGIFRDAKGRHLPVYGDERVAKYLLSEKYVPDNFNAILIGTSVSANWNTSRIDGLHVYNESLDGGNIVEEKAIADQALASSRIKVALLIVQPYLTASHDFRTVKLTPRLNLEALGSLNLLNAYKSEVRIKLHLERKEFDEFGTDDFGDIPHKMNADLQKLMAPGTEFSIDEQAMASYRTLVDELHSSSTPIIYVIPPVSQPILALKESGFEDYSRTILAGKSQRDLVLDFNSDEFAGFRRDQDNFIDGVHLTNQAAREVIADMNTRIDRWIRNGQLPSHR